MKRLGDLLAALPETYKLTGSPETLVTADIVESAAGIQPGGIFVARPGLSADGHSFIPQALERGAAVIVGEREIADLPVPYVRITNAQEAIGWLAAAYHDFPSRKLTVIGVTGTDGKTTTSTLLHSILQAESGGKAGLISTISAQVGDASLDTGLHVTTPGAPEIQALLARMVANDMRYVVLEMTSHGLAQGRLNGVDLDAAALTNVTHEHLDYHGTWEAYRDAKARMFTMLGGSYRKPHQPKIAVINGEDASADYFAKFEADKRVRYGLHSSGDIYATDIIYHPGYTQFVLHEGSETTGIIHLPLIGRFNVLNALAAISMARALGIQRGAIERGLLAVTAVSGRMERIDEGQAFLALVDFAHTPNALKNALETAREMVSRGGRVIAVFGSAGLRDREKRRLMAEVSAQMADVSVFTAEDPRTESLDSILQIMATAAESKGGVEGETFIRVPDRGQALFRAVQMAREGDVVIACGKGHEQSMCFGTLEYDWDDREALHAALRGTPLATLPTALNAQ
ncbi:MAG: UDP-N-acetylmuramoyl-L-alanyl-D-glutamate--2,6-diaminopimelate ligase [Anaerolineae bacterium]|nr:UDP-N-acetylmuramoyl-L-alanyl-D-glutamate--2,6-diaminopimelate ligase [Anaerolineae bacterium]